MSEQLRRSCAPPFTALGVTFTCWIVTDADGGQRYEWRTACGRGVAGRVVREFFARLDGQNLPEQQPSLRHAMEAVARALIKRAAA